MREGEARLLLTVLEAAYYLRLSKSYLDKSRLIGGGPAFIRAGRRKILYRKQDLEEWLRQHRFASTAEYVD
jgi:excisionase family DNA binding protein